MGGLPRRFLLHGYGAQHSFTQHFLRTFTSFLLSFLDISFYLILVDVFTWYISALFQCLMSNWPTQTTVPCKRESIQSITVQ